ncbi:MAG: superoxide dismutase [Marinilabiliales bacterium]|jgi:Fe-Mn family superoxide dismutase|nr:MAG: superoxide dismutase [Marinilabiliales bacterium]
MAYELPALPYELNALEPQISKETLEYHYGKHHAGYVKNLNGLVAGTQFENSGLEEIVKKADGGIFNNGAQVWNHTFYWNCMAPDGGGEPTGALLNAIKSDFGSFEAFKEQFSKAAATLFGSGWAWLVKSPEGKLEIVQESNAGNPLRSGKEPIMTCDVWEHAYYIDKRNLRPAYIEDFWKVVDWNTIGKRL